MTTTPAKDRQRRSLAKLRKRGGRRVHVRLRAEAAAALAELEKNYPNATAAIEQALIAHARDIASLSRGEAVGLKR